MTNDRLAQMLIERQQNDSNFDGVGAASEIPSMQNQTAHQSFLLPVDHSNILMQSNMQHASSDASFVGEVQNLINAPAPHQNSGSFVKN